MENNEKKTGKGKVYDFRHLREEVAIGVFADSDLSKTLANFIYKNTSELSFVKLAFEIHDNGCAHIDDVVVDVLIKSIENSNLKWSIKAALLSTFGVVNIFNEENPRINNLK